MSHHSLRDPTEGSARVPESYAWPTLALAVAILPQVLVPAGDRVGPVVFVPVVESAVFIFMVVIVARRGPVPRKARPVIVGLLAALVAANTAGAANLVALVLDGHPVDGLPLTATRLLAAGAIALTTNVLVFSLLYWQLDRGGPTGRGQAAAAYPDFLFPQDTAGLAPDGWIPRFPDYLYLAYTNLVAFSPADTVPLRRRAKGLMALQSMIALAVIVVVISRVINILPTPNG